MGMTLDLNLSMIRDKDMFRFGKTTVQGCTSPPLSHSTSIYFKKKRKTEGKAVPNGTTWWELTSGDIISIAQKPL